MRIGIEAMHAAKPNRTGVEEYCFQIINHLKTVIPNEVNVELYLKNPTTIFDPLPPNWSLKILPWPPSKLWSQIRLSLQFLLDPPDVFFAPAQLLPNFTPKKTVTTVHDSAFLVYPTAYHFWGRQYLKFMNKRIIKRSAKIITPSEFSKTELIRLYGLKLDQQTVAVPHGFNLNKNCNAKEPSGKAPYLLAVGRLEEKKNTSRLVAAFTLLKTKLGNSRLQLILAGNPGVLYNEVAEKIQGSPYHDDIRELGFVKDEALERLYQNAEALVFPSLYEGFGLPILEAFRSGTPVIVSNIKVAKEVGGSAVQYVDPLNIESIAAGIEQLINNPSLKQELVERGYERLKHFSWEKSARATYDIIAKVGGI